MIGLVSYASYIPKYRLKVSDIAQVWGKDGQQLSRSLGVVEKAVAAADEDAITLGYESARRALARAKLNPRQIEAIFMGSESYPYAVNPSITTIAEFLGMDHFYFGADLEFACKAGSTGLIVLSALLLSGRINYGLVVASDCAQAKPHDVLEYTAASAAVSLVVGCKKEEIVAEIVDFCSYASDTPDFWRRNTVSYPSHGGRFTGEPAYFHHVLSCAKRLLAQTKLKPADFAYCVFHMPNGKFPQEVAKRLGFSSAQLKPSLTVEKIGNPYSASSLLGLTQVLDQAKPNQLIFFVSYGSGAGSDGFVFKTTKNLSQRQKKEYAIDLLLNQKEYISYVDYLKMREKI